MFVVLMINGPAAVIWVIALGILVAIWSNALTRAPKAAQAAREQDDLQAEGESAHAEMLSFFRRDLTPVSVPGVSLKPDEHPYWSGSAAKLISVKHTARVGAYGGPSIRVARGLYLRGGVNRSHNVTSTTEESIAGRLIVTTDRLLFIGPAGTEAYPYDHIVNVESYTDGFHIDAPNKPRVFFRAPQEAVWTFARCKEGAIKGAGANPIPALESQT